jgi:hypothetical protein
MPILPSFFDNSQQKDRETSGGTGVTRPAPPQPLAPAEARAALRQLVTALSDDEAMALVRRRRSVFGLQHLANTEAPDGARAQAS